jgi:hypothetical protein
LRFGGDAQKIASPSSTVLSTGSAARASPMRVNAAEWSLVSKANAERLLAAIRDGDRDKVCLLRARALSSERKRSFRRKLAITFESKREARQPFARRSGVG